jgi:hypothetical protein
MTTQDIEFISYYIDKAHSISSTKHNHQTKVVVFCCLISHYYNIISTKADDKFILKMCIIKFEDSSYDIEKLLKHLFKSKSRTDSPKILNTIINSFLKTN